MISLQIARYKEIKCFLLSICVKIVYVGGNGIDKNLSNVKVIKIVKDERCNMLKYSMTCK